MDAEDLPSVPKKKFAVALNIIHEVQRDLRREFGGDTGEKPSEPHGMAATVHTGGKSRPELETMCSDTPPLPKMHRRTSTWPITEVPEARAVVVLHAHAFRRR